MSQTIRLPDPVYDRATRIAEREDITRGAVVRDWMEKAEKYDQMEVRRR